MKTITVVEAVDLIEEKTGRLYTYSYICSLCRNGTLRAEKRGRDWFVEASSVRKFKPIPTGPKPR